MTWIVVNDPIPAGATILGGGLGRDSTILTGKEAEKGWAREVFASALSGHESIFSICCKGKFTVEYTMRLNNEGMFNLPRTRVEARSIHRKCSENFPMRKWWFSPVITGSTEDGYPE